jgi:Ssp1 endopeptidase immunity protein Rap1a
MTRYAVAILLALTMPASAQDINSANFFLPGCKAFIPRLTSRDFEGGRCVGFVHGLLFAVENICQPQGATIGQAVAVVIKYIEARPERTHESFGVLAYEALAAAWPCKR